MSNTWEELSRKEQLASDHYDFYKEVHGIRPRWMDYETMSEEAIEEAIARLVEEAKYVYAEQEAREQEAISKFKALVETTVANGARDYNTAIRWIAEAADVDGDMEHLCWIHGLPYGYFKESK